MPDAATLLITRNLAFGACLEAALERAGRAASVVEACPPLPPCTEPVERIAARHLAQANATGRDFDAVVLDTHAAYGAWRDLQEAPGLRFFADFRTRGYTVPIVLLTWFEPEDLRLRHLSNCFHLFHRYRAGKHGEEQGSFALRRLPIQASAVLETLDRLRPMTEEEWKEIEPLQKKLMVVHPPYT